MRRFHLLFHSVLSVSLCFLAACSADVSLPVEEAVPLDLCAGGDALIQTSVTRADNLPEKAFDATVMLTTRKGDYSGLTAKYEGSHGVAVGTNGSVSWKLQSGVQPVYPETGSWLYAVAISPTGVSDGSGNVSYTLTGKEDLLYAPEIRGNKWDGDRFAGNTNSGYDKPLEFSHLLTRLRLKACKKQTGGLAVKITRVKVNEAENTVTLPLATGVPAFSGTKGLSLLPGEGNAGKEVPADGTTITLGDLLLPPLAAGHTYTLDVETSTGTYQDIPITFSGTSTDRMFQAGVSHEVTLKLSDNELGILSVKVTPWELVSVDDDLDLVP